MILNNNRISKISNFSDSLPNLENLILTNNKILDLKEIDCLQGCKKLQRLSLLNNPVTQVLYNKK